MKKVLLGLLIAGSVLSAQALDVFEGDLLIRDGGNATFNAGKFWLKVSEGGRAEFQLVLVGFAFQNVSAGLQTPTSVLPLDLGTGETRTYAGCDPLGWNPFLTLPIPSSDFTCPAQVSGTFFQGILTITKETRAQLLAQDGVIRITMIPPLSDHSDTEASGTIKVTGVFNNQQFYLVPDNDISITPTRSSIDLQWPAIPGHGYIIQTKMNWQNPDWQELSPILTSRDRFISFQAGLTNKAPHQFFRILQLRPRS